MELSNTSAIITGGASGLGESTARELAKRGVRVVLADLNAERGEALASELNGTFVSCDVTNTDQVVAAIEAAIALAPLFSVVNCAGVGWATRTIGKDGEYASAHDLDVYRRVIEINLIGTFNVCRLAATKMSQNDPDPDGCRGAIVNTARSARSPTHRPRAASSGSRCRSPATSQSSASARTASCPGSSTPRSTAPARLPMTSRRDWAPGCSSRAGSDAPTSSPRSPSSCSPTAT